MELLYVVNLTVSNITIITLTNKLFKPAFNIYHARCVSNGHYMPSKKKDTKIHNLKHPIEFKMKKVLDIKKILFKYLLQIHIGSA